MLVKNIWAKAREAEWTSPIHSRPLTEQCIPKRNASSDVKLSRATCHKGDVEEVVKSMPFGRLGVHPSQSHAGCGDSSIRGACVKVSDMGSIKIRKVGAPSCFALSSLALHDQV